MKPDHDLDRISLQEESNPPPPTCLGVHVSIIYPVLLRTLILFAIVCMSIWTMIDLNSSAEDQHISIHAEPSALRHSDEISSGTALRRFRHNSFYLFFGRYMVSKTAYKVSIHEELADSGDDPARDDPFSCSCSY